MPLLVGEKKSTRKIPKKDFKFKIVTDPIHFSLTHKTMCVVSKEIKFCTCEEDSTSDLPNYWVLHRFNRDKDLRIVGNIVMSSKDLDPNYKPNKKTIRNRLNKQDAFDKEIPFVENDVLSVVLNSSNWKKREDFCYEYKRGTWINSENDSMWLESRFDVYGYGKVEAGGKPNAGITDINLI